MSDYIPTGKLDWKSLLSTVPLFDGTKGSKPEFSFWKQKATLLLKAAKFDKIIDGTLTVSEPKKPRVSVDRPVQILKLPEDKREFAKAEDEVINAQWERYDNFILARDQAMFLLSSIVCPDGEAFSIIREETDKKQSNPAYAWKRLVEKYQGTTIPDQTLLYAEVHSHGLIQPEGDILKHIESLKRAKTGYDAAGGRDIKDGHMLSILLAALACTGDRYKTLSDTLILKNAEATEESPLTFANAVRTIEKYIKTTVNLSTIGSRIAGTILAPDTPSILPTVANDTMASTPHALGAFEASDRPFSHGKFNKGGKPNNGGHGGRGRFGNRNFRGGRGPHGGRSGNGGGNNRYHQNNQKHDYQDVICGRCRFRGHTAETCRTTTERAEENRRKRAGEAAGGQDNEAASKRPFQQAHDMSKSEMTRMKPAFKQAAKHTYVARVYSAQVPDTAGFVYADSGAERNILTAQFANQHEKSVSYSRGQPNTKIQFGTGQPVQPQAVADFGLMKDSMVIGNTNASTNLMSLSALDDLGIKMVIAKGQIHYFSPSTNISVDADPLLDSFRVGGLYATRPSDIIRAASLFASTTATAFSSDKQNANYSCFPAKASAVTKSNRYSSGLSFHRALAHVSIDKLITMAKHSSVIGLEPKAVTMLRRAKQAENVCLHCQLGHFPQYPVNKVSVNSDIVWTEGQYWKIDYVGKFPTSKNGNTGVFVSNDHASAFTKETYTSSKDVKTSVIPWLKEFIDEVAADGYAVKQLHFDADTIFEDDLVRAYLTSRHIRYAYSEPGEHRHSGGIERCAGTMQNLMRKCLKSGRGEDVFWDFAFGNAVFVSNRVITSRFRKDPAKQFLTPYEIYHGRKPDITKIAMWGAACTVRVPNPRQHLKLDDRGRFGVIVGNSEEHNDAFVVYVLKTKRFVVSKDVVIDENRLGFTGEPADWFTGLPPPAEWVTQIPEFVPFPQDQSAATQPTIGQRQQVRALRLPDTVSAPKSQRVRAVTPPVTGQGNIQQATDPTTSFPPHQLGARHSSRVRAQPAPVIELPVRTRRKNVRFSVTLNNVSAATNEGTISDSDDASSMTSSVTGDQPAQFVNTLEQPNDRKRRFEPPVAAASIAKTYKRRRFKSKNKSIKGEERIPQTYEEAMSDENRHKYEPAIREELESIFDNKVFANPVQLTEHLPILGLKWVFDIKRDSDGNFIRYKARLVAKGFTQVQGESYTETFAATPSREALRILFALAAKYRLQTFQGDVKTAFLNGYMDEAVYCAHIEGLPPIPPGHVLPLVKALYGTRQAARQWSLELDKAMCKLGYTPCSPDESCIYLKRMPDGTFVMIVVYVDDVFGAGNNEKEIARFNREFGKIFKYKYLGEITDALGMKVTRLPCGSLHVSNPRYVDDMLRKFELADCYPRSTPADSKSKLTAAMGPPQGRADPALHSAYREVVGSLIHLMTTVRPDTSAAVSDCGRFTHCPGTEHMRAAHRVLRYLQGTRNYGMVYRALPHYTSVRPILVAYSDANWAESDDRISTSGMVIRLIDESELDDDSSFGDVIYYSTKRQDNITLSSTEAEYVAACTCSLEVVWLRRLLDQLGFKQNKPTVLLEDNTSAIALANRPSIGRRSKHIDVKYHKIRELVRDRVIYMLHVGTEKQWADILTKNTGRNIHCRHRHNLGVIELTDELLEFGLV